MTNNAFFNTFLKKDDLFHKTQNNPITQKEIWSPTYIRNISIKLTDNNNEMINDNLGYFEYVDYFPGPNGRKITRLQRGHTFWQGEMTNYRIKDFANLSEIKRVFAHNFGVQVNAATVLPVPINAATNEDNVDAIIGAERFVVKNILYRKDDDFDTNYWFPNYQGKFTNLSTPNTIQQPAIPQKTKFFPNNFMSEKQKESFLWLKASDRLAQI